jgi:RHS repeat-associated protein
VGQSLGEGSAAAEQRGHVRGDAGPATPTASTNFNAKNQLLVTPSPSDYDLAGNELAGYTLGYDAENRVVSAAAGIGHTVAYGYDGDGRRVTKTMDPNTQSAATTYYVYDAFGQLAAEYGAPGAGVQFAGCATCYLFGDHLGSTRAIWDSGGVKGRLDYFPFGEPMPSGLSGRVTATCATGVTACYPANGDPTQRIGVAQEFTGKERDAESGLDFFGARYFSGAQGRFTSPDRVIVTPARMEDPQRFNLYAYARNNPFKFIDPNGEDIDFANDTEEGRKKALALITKNLSAKETANIGSRQTKDGSYEAYVVDKNAIRMDASKAYSQLTGLINDHSIVADVGLVGGGLTATFSEGALAGRGPISSFRIMGAEGGEAFEPVNQHVNVLVNQGNLPGGVDIFCCGGTGKGIEPDFVTMWHELLGETLKYRSGHQTLLRNPALDSRTVIKIENEIRAVHGMSPRTGADHGQTTITVEGKVQ